MTRPKSLFVVAVVLAVVCAAGAQANEVAPIGQTVSNNLIIDGVAVPAGTTLLDPSVVAAHKGEGQVRLQPGHSLIVPAGSQAVLQSAGADRVRVAVTTGSVAYRQADGGEIVLAQNSATVLPQEGIGEGAAVEQTQFDPQSTDEIPLCVLEDDDDESTTYQEVVEKCWADPDADGCDWKRVVVEERRITGSYVVLTQQSAPGDVGTRQAAVVAGDNELDVSCRKVAAWLWGGGAVLGLVLADSLEDDPPATRVTP